MVGIMGLFRIPSEETVLKKRREEEGRRGEGEKGKMRKCARVKCPRWLATISWQKDKSKERFGRILLRLIALFYTRIGIRRCACARSCAQQEGAGALVASRPDNLKAIRSSLAAACLTRKIFKNWSLPSYLHYISRFVKQDVDEGLRFPLLVKLYRGIRFIRNYICSILISRTFQRLDRSSCVNVACCARPRR